MALERARPYRCSGEPCELRTSCAPGASGEAALALHPASDSRYRVRTRELAASWPRVGRDRATERTFGRATERATERTFGSDR